MNATKEAILSTEHTALAAEITDLVKANLPREKAIAAQQMAQTEKEIQSGLAPGTTEQGLGQPMGSIPPIIYYRWNQERGGGCIGRLRKDIPPSINTLGRVPDERNGRTVC